MLKIKNHFIMITLLLWLFIGSFLAAVEVIYIRSLNKTLRADVAECQDKYDAIKKDVDIEKNKSAEMKTERDSLAKEVEGLDARVIELNKQIELLRSQLVSTNMPPHPKPVAKPPVKKVKKRIPYDIAPSQQ